MKAMMPYRSNRPLVGRRTGNPFDELFRPFFDFDFDSNTSPSSMLVDVQDAGDHYLLEADLPGVKKEDMDIQIRDGVLSIRVDSQDEKETKEDNYLYSERRRQSIHRCFALKGIQEDGIRADYVDGVLTVTLPKSTGEKGARKVQIG